MTTTLLTPDATRCPDCRSSLVDAQACPSCGLSLEGPAAQRLWALDIELLQVDAHRGQLLHERGTLLAALHRGPARPVPAGQPRAEWTPQRVQNSLLVLGGLLLVVAALVFTAVTYERLGAGGRAGVLLILTALAAAAVPALVRRGLGATAETLTAVTIVLAALDAYGLRRLGALPGLSGLQFAAISAGVLAGLAAGAARLIPVRLAGIAAVVAAQLPVPLLLGHADASPSTTALALAALTAADLVMLAVVRAAHVRVALVAAAGLVGAVGVLVALDTAQRPDPIPGAAALVAYAAVLAGASLLATRTRTVLTAAIAPVLAAAAYAVAVPELASLQRPLVLAAVGVLAVACPLPAGWRRGAVTGGLLVGGASVLAVAEPALTGLLLPLTWLLDPWTATTAVAARAAVGPASSWDGTLATPVVLAVASLAVLAAGLRLGSLRTSTVPAAVLAGAAVLLLPLGLDLSLVVSIGLLLLAAAPVVVPRLAVTPALIGAAAVAVHAAAWAAADRELTLVALPVAALILAALGTRAMIRPLTALAAVLAVTWTGAAGAAAGLAQDQVGGLLLLPLAALLAGAPVLDRARRDAVEVVAVLTVVAAAGLATVDAGWLSWVLAGTGLLALATGLRPDRRAVAVAGGLLLSASSWVRLADAEVTAPEPYVLPVAALALLLGHLRRRTETSTRSWSAYGPGLLLLLVPSLLASFDDATLVRPLLLGLASLVVLLLGAAGRLQAPLLVGGAVLATDALQLLAPYAAALPRWLPLAAAGALLVALGATYEQRRRDVRGLRGRYDALS